jgi:hypothetical protein
MAEACSRTVHRRAIITAGAAGEAIRAETAAVTRAVAMGMAEVMAGVGAAAIDAWSAGA